MQASIFEVVPSERYVERTPVEGAHEVSLPALRCGVCGSTWKSVGESYPTAQLVEEIRAKAEARKVLDIAAFDELRATLRRLVPTDAPLYPGATLGVFTGKVSGRAHDVLWHESWTVFISQGSWDALVRQGVRLPSGTRARLSFKVGSTEVHYIEPEALLCVNLSRSGLKQRERQPCRTCGRQSGGFAEFLVDPAEALPDTTDLARAANNPAVLLASERFANAVRTLGLTGLACKPLPIAVGQP